MQPISMTLSDFGSFSHTEIDFSALSLTAIVGENGAGKSTVLTAMRVALFGRAAGSLDGFIRQGARSFMVEFVFDAAAEVYRVVREYNGSTHRAALHRKAGDGWAVVCEAKATDVDAAIVAILGCGYTEFVMAHHLPQGELGHFAEVDPAERKAWLMGNLPLSAYSDLEAKAKNGRDGTNAEVLRLQARLDGISATAGDLDALSAEVTGCEGTLTQLRAALAKTTSEVEEAEARNIRCSDLRNAVDRERRVLDERTRTHDAAVARARAAREEYEGLAQSGMAHVEAPKVDFAAVRAEREQLVAARDRIMVAAEELAACDQEFLAADAKNVTARREAALAQEALDAIVNAPATPCPTCGQQMGKEARETAIAALTASRDAKGVVLNECVALCERAATRQDAATEALSIMEAAGGTREKLAAEIRRCDDTLATEAAYERATAERTATFARLDDAKKRMEAAENDAVNAQVVLGAQAVVLAAAEADADDCEYVDVRVAKDSMVAINAEIGVTLSRLAHLESEVEHAREELEHAKEWGEQLDVLRRRLDLLNLLLKAYGKAGIPARIIEHAVAEIEAHANDFLDTFTDGLSVRFVTQKENKTGGTMRETLDITVTDSSGERAIERFSGGERTRVNFALAVGLARFLASRTSGVVGSFAIDEPEYLDTNGIREIVNCMHKLSASVPSVFLISHYDGVADSLPQRILVKKGANGSSVEVQA